ncbi:MAG: neocarzinostatin apoprotein domain-containing protein [Acidimicrobiales bacterium]
MARRTHIAVVVLAASLALASCSSSTKPSTTSPTSAPTSAPASAVPSSTPVGAQKLTLSPSTGLASPATVHVTASGFSPNEALVVTECASKGSSTGPGDCDLQGVKSVTSDSAGQVHTTITAVRGPFGANHITCGPSEACLVSVSQATTSPTQEADAPISFK